MGWIGQSVPRTDGFGKVTGQAVFVDDMSFEGMLFGATIRSVEPHARLHRIVWDPGFDWSRIVRVEAADIPGRNAVYLHDWDQPALAEGLIRHCEEPVALIAAPDKELLQEARRHVTLQTTGLDPLFDLEESLKAENRIYGEDNVFKSIEIVKGDAPSAMRSASRVIEGEYRFGYQEQMYIEPQGVIAVPTPDGGITIHGSMQCPYYVLEALCPLLDLPPEKVRIIQTITGGAFGGKEEYPSLLSAHAALLALKAGRPVKMVYDRAEDIAATTKRHPGIIRHRTGVDQSGHLLAQEVEILMDGGAYCTLSPVVLSRAAIAGTGPYRCDNVHIRARMLATHKPPSGAFRGFGGPQAAFAAERHLDRIARELGLSPLEVRRRNLLEVGDTISTGQRLKESVGIREVLDAVAARSDFETRYRAYQDQPDDAAMRRGIGLAICFHGGGFTGAGETWLASKVDLELTAQGGVAICCGSTDMGQGRNTVFSQIAADALGVDMALIQTPQPDTRYCPNSGPTVASRTTMVVGRLVEDAAYRLVSEMTELLAPAEGVAPRSIGYHAGAFQWEEKKLPFQQAAQRLYESHGPLRTRAEFVDRDGMVWDPKTYQGDAYAAYSWAAIVTEVEVDMATYLPRVTRVVAAEDIGKAINPLNVEGQIQGGTLQGLGYGSMEVVQLENGRFVNHRMTDCLIPTSMDVPDMDVVIVECPYPHGPSGAKGLGEVPTDIPAPALAAAISQATGLQFDEIPVSPERIAARMAEQKERV